MRKGIKLIEFSIEDLTHPPLIERNNKKTCCFLGFLAHFDKKNFLKFSPAPPTTARH